MSFDTCGLRPTTQIRGADSRCHTNRAKSLVIGSETGEDPNNKIITTRSYNGFGELDEIAAKSVVFGSETKLYEAHYDTEDFPRDALGRIVDLDETVENDRTVYHFEYDEAGRLTVVCRSGERYANYGYDSNGNWLLYRRCAPGAQCDSSTVCEPGTIADLNGIYDDQDRLLKYGDVTYGYTPNGELASKTLNGETTTYTQLNPVAELDGSGDIVSIFVYGSRLNVPEYMLSKKEVGDWEAYRIISDHLGSPRLVVKFSGAGFGEVVQRLDYDEFGNILANTNPGFQPFGFAGGLYDPDTGLIRFGARDYEPDTGRWTAKDVNLFSGLDWNLYEYSMSDPVNKIDLNGLILRYADTKSETIMKPVIRQIMKTAAGRDLLKLLHGTKEKFFIKVTGCGKIPTGGEAVLNFACIDPCANPQINVAGGGTTHASTTRILAHELGHLAQQLSTGINELENIKVWENPIMFPLEGFNRVWY